MDKADTPLYGRKEVLQDIEKGAASGYTLFAFEGVSGIGKSEVLTASTDLVSDPNAAVVRINAAQSRSEQQAIASIYVQLRDRAARESGMAKRLAESLTTGFPDVLRKIGAAVAADLMHAAAEYAEKTIDAVQEIATGEGEARDTASELEALEQGNRRSFLDEFLKRLTENGIRVTIAIDNIDSADTSLFPLLLFLIREKPKDVMLLLAYNTEVGSNDEWDNTLAHVRGRAGVIKTLEALNRGSISEWVVAELGRHPTLTELEQLEATTHGRPFDLKLAIQSEKENGEAGEPARDYSGYYERARRRLSPEANQVAQLLSLLGRDTFVSVDMLAAAAQNLEIPDLSAALDQLRDQRLIRIDEHGYVALAHSLAQKSWQSTINFVRRASLEKAWFGAAGTLEAADLASQQYTGLVPALATPLLAERSAAHVAEIGEKLIESGQVQVGLELLEASLAEGSKSPGDRKKMLSHALYASRTLLEIGRYSEAEAHLAPYRANDAQADIKTTLVGMQLAIRQNRYADLWALAAQLEGAAAGEPESLLDGQLIVNMAYQDLGDRAGLEKTRDRILDLKERITPKAISSVEAALARTYIKLGDPARALEHARIAVEESGKSQSVRLVGNAQLALGEARRYAGDHSEAIAAYRAAAEIARSSGNRDLLLWSLLGEVAAHWESGSSDGAAQPLADLDALIHEPGYEHPIETAHWTLLDALVAGSIEAADQAVGLYEPLGISWPGGYVREWNASGQRPGALPL